MGVGWPQRTRGGPPMAKYTLKVNGRNRTVDAEPDTPLLYVLRENLALKGPRFGCGLGQCGACTVHLDGPAARSGRGTSAKPSKLQRAFIDEQAAQCGYCINGMIMAAAALLATNKFPSETEIREALAGNLCRCGTHQRIIAAIKRAAVA